MIYLDNGATTRPHPQVLQLIQRFFETPWANPSSVHPWGMAQRRCLSQARAQLAGLFGVPTEGVVFCASGTESDNLAIKGSLVHRGKNRGPLITSPLEHKAVLACAQWYEERGGEVRFLHIDPKTGLVDLDDLSDQLTPATCLVSVGQVHSETGVIQDLAALAAVIRQQAPQALFHSDGIQGFGKLAPKLKDWGVDLYSISGHKIHGLVGAAALIKTKPTRLEPQVDGGGQEFGLRAGTENVLAIQALALSASISLQAQASNHQQVQDWAGGFLSVIQDQAPQVTRTRGHKTLPHLIHLQTPGIPGEVFLHHLAQAGLLVSQGSACQARSKALSPGLKALGLSPEQTRQSLRISLSPLELTAPPEQVAGQFLAVLRQLSP